MERKAEFSESAARRIVEAVKQFEQSGPNRKYLNYTPRTIPQPGGGKWLQACKAEGESDYLVSFEDWTKGDTGAQSIWTWNFWDGNFVDDRGSIFSADFWDEGDEPTYYDVINITGQYIPENTVCYCQKSGEFWLTTYMQPQVFFGELDEVLESGGEAEMTITNTTGFQASLGSLFAGGTMTVKDVFEIGDYQEGTKIAATLTTMPGTGWRYVVTQAYPCPGSEA